SECYDECIWVDDPDYPEEPDPCEDVANWDECYGDDGGYDQPSGGDGEYIPFNITNQLTGKANCVYGKLVGTALDNHNIIRQTFMDFGNGLNYDQSQLIYKQQAGLTGEDGKPINGSTGKAGSVYTVTLNSDFIDNRAPIEIAKTILHESVHAIIRRQYNVTTGGFLEYFEAYVKDKVGYSMELSHDIMRDYYIIPIANNLKQFDNNQEPFDFYENLAWEGLHQFLSANEISAIANDINYARGKGLDCN
ncbi:hypothetical protein DN748_12705, partial [Sinomicrobium soli]